MTHPRDVLLGAQAGKIMLPACDHYSGVEARMIKSLQLQAELMQEFGACVVDVTLDCEDGAPIGAEVDQALRVAGLALQATMVGEVARRIGVRLHSVDHPAFASDVQIVVGQAASALSYLMLPKVESVHCINSACVHIDAATPATVMPLPLHVLVESPAALHHVFQIAAHPRVQSVSFGVMDFVSSHAGAIPASAMGVRAVHDVATADQFHHPLVVRAKLEIASACHAFGKVPSHCVVPEFRDPVRLEQVARIAAQSFGYTRMWSIHPDQIRPILRAFSPATREIEQAARIIEQAINDDWAPISVQGTLHDRASYRYYWQVLERAHGTGCALPDNVKKYF
jgi:citrate lyase subunit beta / citryl-CoA lyase